jgi:hypothetical protein
MSIVSSAKSLVATTTRRSRGQEARAQCEQCVDGDEGVGGDVVLLAELQVGLWNEGVMFGGDVS